MNLEGTSRTLRERKENEADTSNGPTASVYVQAIYYVKWPPMAALK